MGLPTAVQGQEEKGSWEIGVQREIVVELRKAEKILDSPRLSLREKLSRNEQDILEGKSSVLKA